jgi:hypothetical protein
MLINEIITELSQAERKARAGTVHDQFFTRPEVAEQFAQWVKSHDFYRNVTRIIEPAAGNRDLARHFPGIEMYDLDPQSSDIAQLDFFASKHQYQPGFLVVMNPPFGAASDLAIRFFNKAATFADYIAMIVPRTFRRSSIQDRLGNNFELVDEYILPRGSFYLPNEGPNRKYDVPAVAQIWRRTETARPKSVPATLPANIKFTTPDQADFAFRKKGRRAGQIVTQDIALTNPNSFFYIKGDVKPFQQINWRDYGNDVMGARNISKADIAQALKTLG